MGPNGEVTTPNGDVTMQHTNSSSSPLNPKMSPGLAKAIAEGTLKFPEGQPEPTFFHCAIEGCGYISYGEIAQKYHAKEVHGADKPKFVEKLLKASPHYAVKQA